LHGKFTTNLDIMGWKVLSVKKTVSNPIQKPARAALLGLTHQKSITNPLAVIGSLNKAMQEFKKQINNFVNPLLVKVVFRVIWSCTGGLG